MLLWSTRHLKKLRRQYVPVVQHMILDCLQQYLCSVHLVLTFGWFHADFGAY